MFEQITDRFDDIFRRLRGLGKITDSNIQETAREIRRVLLEADVNLKVAREFITHVQEKAEGTKVLKSIKPGEQFIKIIHEELVHVLGDETSELDLKGKPAVILMAGLQGSGKTTTCAKLAKMLKSNSKKVLLAAADVYRPAAIEQLQSLGQQIDVPVYDEGLVDPVAICKNALDKAKKDKMDVVILDTAGRLHIDGEMMEEIQQIADETSPNEVLFVADSMTGQDAVTSAKAFSEALPLTGTILTKLDGDARGGAAVSIRHVTGTPIKFAGVSEKIAGLEPFNPKQMADRILGFGDVISLVQKAEEIADEKTVKKLEKKMLKNEFDLEDFQLQLKQLKKMGSLQQLVGMMPGMNRKLLKGMNMDDSQLSWTEAIINSMTVEERKHPSLIDGSRRKRIAKGSGRSLQEVNQLLKQFTQMKKMMKQFGKMKPGKMPLGNFAGIS
ncbi:MAG TPA: signal recognition particle protein [Candidatus Marinimicrobia bacterium]|jgi:signal recognition particle subunit SRP54|nr:signal recognition particle protein [Candidatus Neomarinimicrobiota bacterium]MDP7217672.1 signal recognition particle protein [Candidatus Neomarinimicrobiota bacterium]MDP7436660.1 signal recognition particle protein [Candidatus Neomarinimicrobiota bacterium]MDP7653736.1 signal recognition particle protein [Candidatus Neomarinimicrobiota bacterium]HJL74973.1 signal recognition particle protein [Candidatus Neomarinimicrobiota bacterium]|tara:strand:- start:4432 stop:5760 length:1329 start_codon:yes stop_codon:yes gene_type:complete